MNTTIVAAQPGYFVLTVLECDYQTVDKEPVIAWLCDAGTRMVLPLCVDDAYDGRIADAWAILYPDGKVSDREHYAQFDSVQAWLRFLKHDAARIAGLGMIDEAA